MTADETWPRDPWPPGWLNGEAQVKAGKTVLDGFQAMLKGNMPKERIRFQRALETLNEWSRVKLMAWAIRNRLNDPYK